ncbi:MAG TPA: phosphatase PAP2 family protein [Pyrinomonadaceae bacterium]|nr:phosphatase PAP2 family protein [Pyrinomonadaceae bacterium]
MFGSNLKRDYNSFVQHDEPDESNGSAPEAPQERRRRLRAVRRLWRAETAYLTALAVFAVLAFLARFNAYFGWDLRAARAVQSIDLPGFAALMRFVSFWGSGITPWIITSAVALAFLARRRRSEAAGVILSAGVGQLVNRLIKLLIARPRPASDLVNVYEVVSSESFPSGHVAFYVGFFGFLFFVAFALLPRNSWQRRAALTITALPVALVGLSRVYLGAHWPSDTLGAYLVNGLWLAFCLTVYRRWKARGRMQASGAA